MKIGIKYCGGCNPRYDRIGEVNKLKAEFREMEFVTASDYPDCDVVIVVCGCSAACAERSSLRYKDEMLVPWSLDDMRKVREKLLSLREKAKIAV